MATQFYGLNRGEQRTSISMGTSTTGKAVEVAVNDGVNLTRKEVVDQLQQIIDVIMSQPATPFK